MPDVTAETTKLELYLRALDFAKVSFALVESSIKTVEDKGRNNITLAPTILGFVILILRPDLVAAQFSWALNWQLMAMLAFAEAVLCVIWSFREYLTIIRPTQANQIDPNWIVSLPESVSSSLESVASELDVYKVYLEQGQAAMRLKSQALKNQTLAMFAMTIFIGLYFVFSLLHLGLNPVVAPHILRILVG